MDVADIRSQPDMSTSRRKDTSLPEPHHEEHKIGKTPRSAGDVVGPEKTGRVLSFRSPRAGYKGGKYPAEHARPKRMEKRYREGLAQVAQAR